MLCSRYIKRKIFKAALLTANIRRHEAKKQPHEVQTIIIGGGVAGLSAASHLIKNGYQRTLVVEATERFGGRVNSRKFGDAFCELGAKWISTDGAKNSMYELIHEASGVPKKTWPSGDLAYVTTCGNEVTQKIPDVVEALFREISSNIKLKEKLRTGDLSNLNNVHEYFQSETSNIINSIFKVKDREAAKNIFDSLFKEFSSFLGCCLEYVNIEHLINLQNSHINPIYIPTGLDSILQPITDNIDAYNMKMGKPVGNVLWHSNSNLGHKYVACLDGSGWECDHIICTLPLGVLKNFSKYMFKPMLPKEKMQAINKLGFGNPVKIYFEYEKKVMPWFKTNVRPLWSAEERAKNLKWVRQVAEIAKLPTSNHVLEIQIGGGFYEEIEKLPDVEVLNAITKLLRRCLNNDSIPYPTSMLRSNWSSCACYLGGRPYFSTKSTMNDVSVLAAPLGLTPSLLFAGDATILNGFGTIDGARISGIREAQRIIDYYGNSIDQNHKK